MASRIVAICLTLFIIFGLILVFDLGGSREIAINHTKPLLYFVKGILLGKS